MSKITYTVLEVSQLTGLDEHVLTAWIENEWLTPPEPHHLDQQDVARVCLIHELQHDFGVNDEAIPLILHLLDQLYHFRDQLGRIQSSKAKV